MEEFDAESKTKKDGDERQACAGPDESLEAVEESFMALGSLFWGTLTIRVL